MGNFSQQAIAEWTRKKIKQSENGELKNLPAFLKDKKKHVKALFERSHRYFVDIIMLEKFFERIKDRDFSEVLASIGIRNFVHEDEEKIKESNPFFKETAEIIVVDDLSDGAHAEMRIFKHLKSDERLKEGQSLPYFGITMLCCPNCHLFLRAHGVDYVEGKRYRAGLHAQHYPGWVFDLTEFSEENIEKFLGDEAFDVYKTLVQTLTFNGETCSEQKWVFSIIEELATLEEKELYDLGFLDKKITSQESAFADYEAENTKFDLSYVK